MIVIMHLKKRRGFDMEIRMIYENEAQMAVRLAHEVFEMCVKPYARTGQEVEAFYGYVRAENLIEEMRAGRLLLWGAYEGRTLCAVSAMQAVGHITMLYVRPQYMKRKIGTQLLNEMMVYARDVLGKGRVTINVMPIVAAPFFYKNGFFMMQNVPMTQAYISLERGTAGVKRANPILHYEKRQVKSKTVVALVVGVLLFCMVTMTVVTVRHIVVDGLCTEADYELQSYETDEL